MSAYGPGDTVSLEAFEQLAARHDALLVKLNAAQGYADELVRSENVWAANEQEVGRELARRIQEA